MWGIRTRAGLAAVTTAGLVAACGGSGGTAHHTRTQRSAQVSTGSSAMLADASASTTPRLVDKCVSPRGCLSPQTLRAAYGIRPLIARGIDGRGVTVALPEEGYSMAAVKKIGGGYDVVRSLAAYDARFGLPPARLSVDARLDPEGAPRFAASPEEMLDIEMVHAIAPGAAIRVVLTADILGNPAPVLREAATQGDVVSISYGTGERCFRPRLGPVDAAFRLAAQRRVTVLASAGDDGAAAKGCPDHPNTTRGVGMFGSDPLVTSVGGTTLTVDRQTGAYVGETVWNNTADNPSAMPGASGGGFSKLFARPPFQRALPGPSGRAVPDVSFDADPLTGPATVVALDGPVCKKLASGSSSSSAPASTAAATCGFIASDGGTSDAAPAWAGLVALADQLAHRRLGFIDPALYRIAESSAYHRAFHDVTSGNNTVTYDHTLVTGYDAGPGWDPATGWGTPDAQVLVPLLAR